MSMSSIAIGVIDLSLISSIIHPHALSPVVFVLIPSFIHFSSVHILSLTLFLCSSRPLILSLSYIFSVLCDLLHLPQRGRISTERLAQLGTR